MSAIPVLTVERLSKHYSQRFRAGLRHALFDIGRELTARPPSPLRRGAFCALDDISFALRPGEAMAVVGCNGVGKTTLLKLILGLLKPDAGRIVTRGRVEAIIELGSNVAPLLSGRENIRLAAALHGLDRRATIQLEEEVIAFAEIESAIDTPALSYSSGMKARLAYSLAAHLRPDLLLVDEALAVGDLAFQRKCVGHMRRYIEQGGALLLVSHNAFQVQAVCSRGILLQNGRLTFDGSAIAALEMMMASDPPCPAEQGGAGDTLRVVRVEAGGPDGAQARTGGPLTVRLHYASPQVMEVHWTFQIFTGDAWVCVTGGMREDAVRLAAGTGVLACTVPKLPLTPGRYLLRATLLDPVTRYPLATSPGQGGAALLVRGVASVGEVLQLQAQQLVTLDIQWEDLA